MSEQEPKKTRSSSPNAKHLSRGFSLIDYEFSDKLQAFLERWGGDDPAILIQVLHEGRGDDQLVAIGALGALGEQWVCEHLVPLLQHPNPRVQWVSALVLGGIFGTLKEVAAIPRLTQALTEFFPTEAQSLRQPVFDEWRPSVAFVLGEFQRPELVPPLRQALILVCTHLSSEQGKQEIWLPRFRDALAYALGRLNAFGVPTGSHIPEQQLAIAQLHLICGYVKARGRCGYPQLHFLLVENGHPDYALRLEVAMVLEQRFGLTQEEQEQFFEQVIRVEYPPFF